MISELKQKPQITIYRRELFEEAVYPKSYIDKILKDVESVRYDVASGRRPVFDNVDDFIASLECDDQ